MLRSLLAAVAIAALAAAPAHAEDAPAAGTDQHLTLDECLHLVVAKNPDLASSRLDAQLGDLDLASTEHRYGLFFDAGPSVNRSISPTDQTLVSGGVSQLQELNQTYKLSLRQELQSGGNVTLGFQNGVTDTNSKGVDINPAYTPEATFTFTQPLMRNALTGLRDVTLARLQARQQRLRVQDKLMSTVADAESAYWSLVAARKGLEVREQSLKLVQDLVHIDEEKAKAGLLAKLDVLQAKASLAVRDGDLLAARRDLAKAQDKLRAMIDPNLQDAAWEGAIVPADLPTFKPRAVSFSTSWQIARARRRDLAVSALERERTGTQLDESGNHLWPKLDLTGSAGVTNLGGDFNQAVTDLPSLRNYNLGAGVTMEWPLGHTSDQDEYTKSRLRKEQADLADRATRQRAYAEVRDAVRDVDIDAKRVEATRLARDLAFAKLDAEQAKLKAGLSTNFEVLQFQEDYEQASLQEVQATIEYLQAQTRLEQVQGTLLEARGLVVAEKPPAYTFPEHHP